MDPFSILVVDDDPDFLSGIIRTLEKQFTERPIVGVTNGETALNTLKETHVGVMLTDFRMPGMTGMDLIPLSLEINPFLCIIMLTGYGTVEHAVSSLKTGAWDFITKPVKRETLYHTVEKAVEYYSLASENRRLTALISGMKSDPIVNYESPQMKRLIEKISAVASSDYTVLVSGESGSGKEYAARTIHRFSNRSKNACHALNCPAIPEPLLESELFGHTKGAFTGADRSREGFFMSADKGTLILDEIGDISMTMQAKLLKFMQDKEVKPVGSSSTRKADVRIIALTNQNLEQKIAEGSFREDLYYRLNVLTLDVPPLRQRREDIPLLVREFIHKTCHELNIEPVGIAPQVLSWLARQPWPGNVRELQNFVRRLVVFSNEKPIDMPLLKLIEGGDENRSAPTAGAGIRYMDAKKEAMDLFSKEYLTALFEQTRGNVSETSRISGLERASIQKIIKRLDIDIARYRRS